MTTLTDIVGAFAKEYLERYPNLPTAHQKVLSAILNCTTGYYGHSLYACQHCGKQHRVNHSCGNRHCPQCQHHKTQQWLHHQLEKQLPGPHFLITFTVPETASSGSTLPPHPLPGSNTLSRLKTSKPTRMASLSTGLKRPLRVSSILIR